MNAQTLTVTPIGLFLLTALLCWIFGRRVPTRVLGIGTAIVVFVGFVGLLLASRSAPLPIEIGGRTWLQAYGIAPQPVSQATIGLHLDGLSIFFASIALVGTTLGVLYLAQSLGASLIGYGRLWSSILLTTIGVVVGILAADGLLLAFGWGLATVGATMARLIVGSDEQRTPGSVGLAGISGFALLLALVLWSRHPNEATNGSFLLGDIGVASSLVAWLPLLLAVAIALGLPPFGRVMSNDEHTTPALHSLIISCGLPLLAIYTFLRVFGLNLGSWSPRWMQVLQWLGFGAMVASGAFALRSRRFGSLLGWQTAAQWGGIMLLLGTYDTTLPLGSSNNLVVLLCVLLLILSTVGSTLASGTALGWLEQRSGSDVLDQQPLLTQPQRIAGFTYALAAATALGLPPLPGYWARRWMFDHSAVSPWLVAAWTVGGVLLAISYISPLALFWRNTTQSQSTEQFRANSVVLLSVSGGLLVLGLFPDVLLRVSLLPALQAILPVAISDNLIAGVSATLRISFGVLMMLSIIGVARSGISKRLPAWTGGERLDRDEGTPHHPAALGETLRPLSLLAHPLNLGERSGIALQRLSKSTGWVLQFFSGRFYLTGILIAAATLILLLL